MKLVRYIPEIKGCYGPRLWVDKTDKELCEFLKLICLWGSPVAIQGTGDKYECCYELPIGTFDNSLWRTAMHRLELRLVEDGGLHE